MMIDHGSLVRQLRFSSPSSIPRSVARQPSPEIERRVLRAAELIQADYARPLKVAELARVAQMSEFHFVRVFGAVVGVSPHRYLMSVRLDEAVRRLAMGHSVTRTSYGVGFSSPSHFAAAFRRRFGVTPSTLTGRRVREIPRRSRAATAPRRTESLMAPAACSA